MIKNCIIVDIDDCFFDSRVISKYLPSNTKSREEWNNFHKHYKSCTPNPWCVDLIKKYIDTHLIIFLTSREDERNVRLQTQNHICSSLGLDVSIVTNIQDPSILYNTPCISLVMREYNDMSHSYICKKKLFFNVIKPVIDERRLKIDFAIDDCEDNIKMFRELGIQTLHCSYGNGVKIK